MPGEALTFSGNIPPRFAKSREQKSCPAHSRKGPNGDIQRIHPEMAKPRRTGILSGPLAILQNRLENRMMQLYCSKPCAAPHGKP